MKTIKQIQIDIDYNSDSVISVIQCREVQEFKVGDMVKVTDGSYNKELRPNRGKERPGIDQLFKEKIAIVNIINCNSHCDAHNLQDRVILTPLDLLLKFEDTDIEIYCSSICVQKVD